MNVHTIEALPNIVQAIINGTRTFHVVDNLPFCIQSGDQVTLKGGGKEVRCIALDTTNEHQHINHLVIGLRVLGEETDAETFARLYGGVAINRNNNLEAWDLHGYANKQDFEDAKHYEKRIKQEEVIQPSTPSSRKMIADFKEKLAEIEERKTKKQHEK